MSVRFEYDFDSALGAMVYIASKNLRNLDKYKLCKLIFLADKSHLVRYSRPITGDVLCAMEYGPVPSTTLNLLTDLIQEVYVDNRVSVLSRHLTVDKNFRYPHFSVRESCDFSQLLSLSDIDALDQTIEFHGNKTFEELKALTHEMPAWKNAWSQSYSRNTPMKFEDLFAEDGDAISGAFEEMIENDKLRDAFSKRVSSE
jgi:uncharacterized phage-associated protein